ncbi:uncharacterized protein TNCV_2553161 [Trichonephila clavipes]|nr:uncharacterized protein TNCV_2553161 [Trichonephila clavipes]
MKFSEGCKSFEMCKDCSSEPALTAHILECLGLTKQDLADDPLLMMDFLKVYRFMDLDCSSPVVKVSDHGKHVMSSSPVTLETRGVGQRCTLNLSRTLTSSRWCGVVVRKRGVSSGVVLLT